MSPSSLLNVSPDLMRQQAQAGMPDTSIGADSDRRWAIGLSVTLTAVAALLFLALG
jgi:hypothetical protein